MALTQELPFLLTFNWRDNNRKPSSASFNLDPAIATVADLLTAANAIRNAVVPLSNASYQGATLSVPLSEDAIPAVAPPDSEVERKLLLPLRGSNPRQVFTGEIPSVVFSVEQVGTDNVDPANPLVAALVAALIANATTNRGEALLTVNGIPYVDHRNRRRS